MSKAWVTLLGLVPMVVACGKNVEGPFDDEGRYEGRYTEDGAPEGWGAEEGERGQARREARQQERERAREEERLAARGDEPGRGSPPGWREAPGEGEGAVVRAGERAAERADEAAREAGQTAEEAAETVAETTEEAGEEAAATAEEVGEDVAATAEEVTEGDERQAAGDRDAARMRRERPAITRPTPAPPPEPAAPEAEAPETDAARTAERVEAEVPPDREALLRGLREDVDRFRTTEDVEHQGLVQALHGFASMLRASPGSADVSEQAERIDGYADRIDASEPTSIQHAAWTRAALTQGARALTSLVAPLDDDNLDARVRDLRGRIDALPTDQPLLDQREAYGAALDELASILVEVERPAPPAGTR